MQIPVVLALAVWTGLAAITPAQAEDIAVGFAPSTAKIMRDARPDTAAAECTLAAARNEVEHGQVVLWSAQAVTGVRVTATALVNAEGGRLDVSLFKVAYVPIKKERVPYPDPLPPLTGPIDLEPNQAQPVWFSVRVPKGTKPGAYRGAIKIEAGTWTKELKLTLNVWAFTLPDTPACITSFGNSAGGSLAPWFGVEPGSPESKALDKKLYELLLDHRLSPMFIPADLMTSEAESYLNDPRMTSYVIPCDPDDAKLQALVARLIEGGWFKKGFFYVVDKPITKPAFDALVAAAERLRKVEPQYRLISPFWGNPDFDEKLRAKDVMLGRVNIWCPHLNYVGSEPGIRKFLQGRKNAGDDVWWYVCNNPREPRNNLEIDQNALAHRVLPWQQKREGLDGLLYWSVCYWDRKFINDPWENMDTIGTGFWGDGSLVYPGKKLGINDLVSSIRLEVYRDGLEDYDYLALADRLLGPKATADFVARIARGLDDYERDPAKFEPVRRELGVALEKAMAQPRPD